MFKDIPKKLKSQNNMVRKQYNIIHFDNIIFLFFFQGTLAVRYLYNMLVMILFKAFMD